MKRVEKPQGKQFENKFWCPPQEESLHSKAECPAPPAQGGLAEVARSHWQPGRVGGPGCACFGRVEDFSGVKMYEFELIDSSSESQEFQHPNRGLLSSKRLADVSLDDLGVFYRFVSGGKLLGRWKAWKIP